MYNRHTVSVVLLDNLNLILRSLLICFKYSYSTHIISNLWNQIIVIILTVNYWSMLSTEMNILCLTVYCAIFEHLYWFKCYFRVTERKVNHVVDKFFIFICSLEFLLCYTSIEDCVMCMKYNCDFQNLVYIYILLKLTITTMK